VRRWRVTDASVHDSRVLDEVLDVDNTASDVWADSAYRSAETEARLQAKGLRSRIHRQGRRNRPLTAREQRGNRTRSAVRARVEHVFGAQSNDMGGVLVRSIGLVRAKARIGLKNLAYNMRRLAQLRKLVEDGHLKPDHKVACNVEDEEAAALARSGGGHRVAVLCARAAWPSDRARTGAGEILSSGGWRVVHLSSLSELPPLWRDAAPLGKVPR
jgi:hypothetical protein